MLSSPKTIQYSFFQSKPTSKPLSPLLICNGIGHVLQEELSMLADTRAERRGGGDRIDLV